MILRIPSRFLDQQKPKRFLTNQKETCNTNNFQISLSLSHSVSYIYCDLETKTSFNNYWKNDPFFNKLKYEGLTVSIVPVGSTVVFRLGFVPDCVCCYLLTWTLDPIARRRDQTVRVLFAEFIWRNKGTLSKIFKEGSKKVRSWNSKKYNCTSKISSHF